MAQHKSLAMDLFEDMGRKVAEASAQQDGDDDTKVVDEIESLCMNCHENVRRHATTEPARPQF
jgi:zinc finger protein